MQPFARGSRSNPFSLLQEEGEGGVNMSKDKEGGPVPTSITGGRTDDKLLQVCGLNHSFSQALKQKLEREPAADLAPLFRQYEDHWRTLAARYPFQEQIQDAAVVPPTNASGRSGAGPLLEPSKASTVFHEGEPSKPSMHSSTLIGGKAGKPMVPSVTSSLGADKPAQPFAFGFGRNEAARPFTFGTDTERMTFATASNTDASKSTSIPGDEPKSAVDKPSSGKLAPLTFGSSAGQSGLFSFGGGQASAPKNATNAPAGTGSASPFSFTAFGTNDAVEVTSKSAEAGATGSSSTPMAAPPSFSFGGLASSSSAATTTAATPFSFSFSTPLPSFSTLTQQTSGGANGPAAHDEDEEGIPEGEEASFSGERTNTELIKRGAGEENEETLAEERIKLFSLERDSGGGWKDLGVAIAKVNRTQDTDKRRLLARSEGTGKVLLNTWISGAATKVDHIEGKKDFTLICVGAEGKPLQYLIRCKEPAQAASFSAAIISQQG